MPAFRKLLLDAATSDTRVPSNGAPSDRSKLRHRLDRSSIPAPPPRPRPATQCNRMIDLIIRALAPMMPEQVIAGSSASISFAAYSGVHPHNLGACLRVADAVGARTVIAPKDRAVGLTQTAIKVCQRCRGRVCRTSR